MTDTDRPTGADIDAIIEHVAREMLDAEPPAGFSRRVLDRLDTPRRRFAWTWVVLPIAATAALLLAIVLPRSNDGVIMSPSGTGSDDRLPVSIIGRANAVSPTRPALVLRAAPASVRTVHAASIDEPMPPADDPVVPALAGPSPITLDAVGQGKATPMTTIDVAPMDVPALQITALSETPRERPQE